MARNQRPENGFGTYVFDNGIRYEGRWRNGKRHGHGVMTTRDGRRFDGNFENDVARGYAVCTWPDGAKFVGNYRMIIACGMIHGPGAEECTGPFYGDAVIVLCLRKKCVADVEHMNLFAPILSYELTFFILLV